MKLIIARHAETNENNEGIIQGQLPGKLSERGKLQAKRLAERLKTEIIHNIYSSDLARAVDTTAEIIKFHKNIPVNYLEILRERHLGELQGKRKEELQNPYYEKMSSVLYTEKGESLDDLLLRAGRILDMMNSAHPDDTILLVIHGGTGKALISLIEGKHKETYNSLPTLKNASLSIYRINEKGGNETILFNNTDHLNFSDLNY